MGRDGLCLGVGSKGFQLHSLLLLHLHTSASLRFADAHITAAAYQDTSLLLHMKTDHCCFIARLDTKGGW